MAVSKKDPAREHQTLSGIPLKSSYGPDDLTARGWRYEDKLGDPGQFPYTRGVHQTMYRGKPWTMRMFAGFGTPVDTNKRFHFLLEAGQTGLSTAFDMPTLMGYDPDHPRSLGEVGREGVSVSTLEDAERLFAGIPLEDVTTSMTINAPAAVLLKAFYIAVAEQAGASRRPSCAVHAAERHAEGVHRAKRVDLTGAAEHPRDPRHAHLLHERDAALEHHLDQRLPHPRGRRDRGAGARVHPGRRHRLRPAWRGRRAGRRRVRAAVVILLRCAQRLLRGDRQVSRGAAHVGDDHARPLRRQEPALVDPAHARADGRRVAHGPATAPQHRAHDHASARRGPRRHAVAPHQQLRRNLRPADRGRRDSRLAARSRSSPRRAAWPAWPIRWAARTSSRR